MSARPVSLFGEMLRRYRAAIGLSQEELAERAHLSARAISDLERGVKRAPHKETVELLANALALPPQKRALFAATARPTAAPPLHSLRRVSGDLATPLTPMIGRERELLAVSRLLARSDARLITFSGPGGVGKTRFILHLAEELAEDYDDGVYLAPLASVRDAALALPTLARVLGVREEPGVSPLELVKTYLHQRQTLLILDNFEHLLAVTPSISELLAGCPRLRVMITSRQPLRIRGEREFPIAPLGVDAAMRLFLDRMHAVHPIIEDDSDAMSIARQICIRLDCLPLALELAAVRTRMLPLPALLQRLDPALTLLTVGPRDLPERQQTLRRTIAWGVDLLDESERRLFQWLAVFVGGCAVEAVREICAPIVADSGATFDTLSALAEKSLLQFHVANDGALRFSMLETIRDYALESLSESGQEVVAQGRHAHYYAALADEAQAVEDEDARHQRLLPDLGNLRAALTWTLAHRRPDVGLRLCANLARLWYMHGYTNEGEEWLRALLELDATSEQRADPQVRLQALYGASRFAMDRRDYTRAATLAEESLALARQTSNAGEIANALATLGHVAEASHRYEAACERFSESLSYSRQASDIGAVGRALSSLGNLARMRGQYLEAVGYLEESLAISRQLRLTWGVINGLTSLGHVACEQRHYSTAVNLYQESLHLCLAMPNEAVIAWLLEGIAVVAVARDACEQASRLCGMIARLRHEEAVTAGEHPWPPYERAIEAARVALGPAMWRQVSEAGRSLSTEDAIRAALSALE